MPWIAFYNSLSSLAPATEKSAQFSCKKEVLSNKNEIPIFYDFIKIFFSDTYFLNLLLYVFSLSEVPPLLLIC